ncbi:MAG: redoxin domain-containing protein [Deltaproteobacteria bacterium]|nr:redoxin domain-containing protein [Deltaproteobacteria bacterium]
MKRNGINVASISYDPHEILSRFAGQYHITYPMLSDHGSLIIRKFGILNTNVPPGTRLYGIPFPGQYLLTPDGIVRDKLFLPDYQTRPTASEVLLKEYGIAAADNGMAITAEDVQVRIVISDKRAFSGQRLGTAANFKVAPGWHIYGEPLPAGYSPTSVKFDDGLVASQALEFPPPKPVKFELLGETLPVYQGEFKATGYILFKQKLPAGEHELTGTLSFQECNDNICKLPQSVRFQIPIKIDPYVPAAAAK